MDTIPYVNLFSERPQEGRYVSPAVPQLAAARAPCRRRQIAKQNNSNIVYEIKTTTVLCLIDDIKILKRLTLKNKYYIL